MTMICDDRHDDDCACFEAELPVAPLVEAAMPTVVPHPRRTSGAVMAAVLAAAAAAIGALYIGLPLVLTLRGLTGDLSTALPIGAAVLVLAGVGVLQILRRTARARTRMRVVATRPLHRAEVGSTAG